LFNILAGILLDDWGGCRNFEELNNLWGVLGGSCIPSVVYKMRLVKIQASTAQIAPEITN